MANNNEKTVFLASSEDWESWNLQFQAQAVAGGLWGQVQGVTPFLKEPTAPNPTQHKHKNPSQSTITARGSTESVAGDDEPGQASQLTTTRITTADLTTEGFRTYQMDWTIYQANEKKYIQQMERVKRLKQWILKTTSLHLQLTSCDPSQPISHWYKALTLQAGISDDEALHNAREAYRVAIKPLLRAPKDLIKWSESWEQAIAMAQRKGVPEALTTKTWFSDFLDAVKPILSHWVTSYKLIKSAQLTLNYRAVANDFREEVRQSTKARILVSNRIAKGSFSPSFAGKEAKNAYQEDAFDSEIEPGSDKGEQNNGGKRQRSSGTGNGKRKKQKASDSATPPDSNKPKNGPKKAPEVETLRRKKSD
ncbi:hypothetical protein B0T14DRAFT_597161 [Immersiella caudata]|uniref:Gag protein n=1 Tax=Immersiella caudata TaxID=314043 RepID=A0AA39XD99_9PEZI|nr:hypothetical protein B0T14DRAFT_597161 [Immersiella caudata]